MSIQKKYDELLKNYENLKKEFDDLKEEHEELLDVYNSNLSTCKSFKSKNKKLKTELDSVLKSFDSLAKIYFEDKTIAEFNNESKCDESELTSVGRIIKKVNPKFDTKKYTNILKYKTCSKRVETLSNKINSSSKITGHRIIFYSHKKEHGSDCLYRHCAFSSNKENYLRHREIMDDTILVEHTQEIEKDKKIIQDLLNDKILEEVDPNKYVCYDLEKFKSSFE